MSHRIGELGVSFYYSHRLAEIVGDPRAMRALVLGAPPPVEMGAA
ncbi:MAG TPA: hypothetical protein VML75_15695 [Kofleriaceae bacterium]|nr:hypothetical protein [Kofleriaceae bacterium]